MGRAQGLKEGTAISSTPRRGASQTFTFERAKTILGKSAPLLDNLAEHHPYTGVHSLRVAELAQRTSRYLGLSAKDEALTIRCALLHDVGKVTVPVTVLDGSAQLEPEEWKALEGHSAAGESLTRQTAEDEELTQAVRAIHERPDGRGYPDRKTIIPLAARIVAVCDAYEAMTCSERNYRQPATREEAKAQLIKEAGSHFDSNIVEAFCQAIG